MLRLAVEALREADGGRWGTTYWTHPPHADNWSRERLAYYLGNGDPVNSTNIRVIEYLLFANGSIFWWDATDHLRTDYPNATGVLATSAGVTVHPDPRAMRRRPECRIRAGAPA